MESRPGSVWLHSRFKVSFYNMKPGLKKPNTKQQQQTNKNPKLLPKEYAKWQMTQVQKEDWGPGLGDLSHLRGHGEGPDLHGGKSEDKEWTTSPSWVTWSRI